MAASESQKLSLSSSSSSSNYDIFLSYHTPTSFVQQLHTALNNISVFGTFLSEVRVGEISKESIAAIEQSNISIVVLSASYSSSRRCLEEVQKIMEYRRRRGHKVIPIFYDVDPRHVRSQTDVFGSNFKQHKGMEEVKYWKLSLSDVSNISGWNLHQLPSRLRVRCIPAIVQLFVSGGDETGRTQAKFISEIKAKYAKEKLVVKERTIYNNIKGQAKGNRFVHHSYTNLTKAVPIRISQYFSNNIARRFRKYFSNNIARRFRKAKPKSSISNQIPMQSHDFSDLQVQNARASNSKRLRSGTKYRKLLDDPYKSLPENDEIICELETEEKLSRSSSISDEVKSSNDPDRSNDEIIYEFENEEKFSSISDEVKSNNDPYRSNDEIIYEFENEEKFSSISDEVNSSNDPYRSNDEIIYEFENEEKFSSISDEVNSSNDPYRSLPENDEIIYEFEDEKLSSSSSSISDEVKSSNNSDQAVVNTQWSIYIRSMDRWLIYRKAALEVRIPDQWLIYGPDEGKYNRNGIDDLSTILHTCLIDDMNITRMKQASPSLMVARSPQSLKILDISHTQSLVRSPPFSGIQNLEILTLRGCVNLVEISQSIEMVQKLSVLDIRDCKSLTKLPKNISSLRFLECLKLFGSSSLCDIPCGLKDLKSLKEFHADGRFILLLLKSYQADMMELEMDFPKTSATLSEDNRKLFRQIEKAQLEYEIRQKLVTTLHLKVLNLANNKLSEFPKFLNCPSLEKLYLQSNPYLRDIPSSFFEQMPVLKVLDMSNTRIKSLPPSAFKLVRLEELVLRGCKLLIELPHEIGALKSLKILDLEGTDLVCLPEELGELVKLEFLEVSLYDAESYRVNKHISAIIPRSILSTLTQLKELNIYVDPHDVWWNDAIQAIFRDLPTLRMLKSLKLYIPTTELLQDFLKLEWNKDTQRIYQNLSHFCLIVGTKAPRMISRVPHVLEEEFLKFDRCIKHINGRENTIQLAEAIKHAKALYLDRHWTIKNLSVFKVDKLKELILCLLVDCNEMESVLDGSDFYEEGDEKGDIVQSLQYLGIYYLKKLEFIWKGRVGSTSLSCLNVLTVHMCPNLTVIFTPILLQYLVNLTEIIVEDCPKIKTLVTLDPFEGTSQQFLPRLNKLSLLNLPELDSIWSGFQVGPKLERIVVYDCPKLKSLSCKEVCNKQIKAIKGESGWWKSLEWNDSGSNGGQPDYLSCAYSLLDKDLQDELAPLSGISVPH